MIKEFRDNYSFLSNFSFLEKPFRVNGITYPTIEHYYVAMKTLDRKERFKIANHHSKGLKKAGRELDIRPDWEAVKLNVMERGLRYKFSDSNPRHKRLLLRTRGRYIQEGNYWNDKFWGVCLKSNQGQNHLGKLLMKIREEGRL